MPLTSRAELEAELRAVALRLIARQLARAAFTGIAGGAIALGLSVVFLDLLPRLLFATTGGIGSIALGGAAGFLLGVGYELRRYRLPGLQEVALALEARLPHDTGALAAALRVVEGNVFYRPLLARAAEELKQAVRSPAPVLIPTRRLVAVPLLALASGVLFAAVVSAERPVDGGAVAGTEAQGKSDSWSSVDVGGSRAASDRDAYRKALGMKETATQLKRTAAVLRDTAATDEQRNRSLTDARNALKDGGESAPGLAPGDLPDAAPLDAAARAELADKLDAGAAALRGKASALENGKPAGSEDSGKDGTFDTSVKREDLVAMPVIRSAAARSSEAIAAQTPRRRAMAERAIKALNELQER
ncbi:MAG: hypothetical protein H6839_09430 [Planctomycetes bacterium]|nr:hypothetical protein [Planctomycetota bacterium]